MPCGYVYDFHDTNIDVQEQEPPKFTDEVQDTCLRKPVAIKGTAEGMFPNIVTKRQKKRATVITIPASAEECDGVKVNLVGAKNTNLQSDVTSINKAYQYIVSLLLPLLIPIFTIYTNLLADFKRYFANYRLQSQMKSARMQDELYHNNVLESGPQTVLFAQVITQDVKAHYYVTNQFNTLLKYHPFATIQAVSTNIRGRLYCAQSFKYLYLIYNKNGDTYESLIDMEKEVEIFTSEDILYGSLALEDIPGRLFNSRLSTLNNNATQHE